MCGISALVGSTREIGKMTDVIEHRGPDGEGFVTFQKQEWSSAIGDGDVAFGHRRLAIIDLTETGHQPMATSCERYWVTYNGEIYNAPELRRELELCGHSFKGTSDTEVLLYAYKEWGAHCLDRLNGMFAFVLYDRKRHFIFSARDRFGIKPLYFWRRQDKQWAFASEIKQFTVLKGWEAKVNRQRAYDFLAWEAMDHTSETLFLGVNQLRGGESFSMTLGEEPRIHQWYSPKVIEFKGTYEQASGEFRELLNDSIALRLRADVEVGSCLSGGLDSSAIVCLANQQLRESGHESVQSAFSACSTDPKFDERKYVETVVKHTGVKPHYVYPSFENLFCHLDELTWVQEEPFISTSIYAQWEVFRLAHQNKVKVMLDGQGADEQLAGYSSFGGRRARELLKQGRISTETSLREWLQVVDLSIPEPIRQYLRNRKGLPTSNPSWLSTTGVVSGDPFRSSKGGDLREYSLLQLTRSNLPKLLHWEDRDSMAHSVESRTPFLDYRLVEFVLSLPSEFKLDRGLTKRVLRTGLERDVPGAILDRRDKMGFVTPEQLWLQGEGKETFLGLVGEAVERSGGLLNSRTDRLCREIADGRRAFSSLPWRVASFGAWMKRFDVNMQ